MIKEIFFGMLAGSLFFLFACSEQQEYDSIINREVTEAETVDVNISLSSIPQIQVEGNTEYRPMYTRGENNVKSLIQNTYKCLVLKEIDNKWYVDTLTQRTLTNDGAGILLKVTDDTKFNDLKLTLRPGHYRVLVVLNTTSTKWNPDLKTGALVKGDADTIAYAYTYNIIHPNDTHLNRGKREVKYEVFAGTAEFTVNKTKDVHSPAINGNTRVNLSRKVMQMRFLLKDRESNKEKFNFSNTQHTVFFTLIADREKLPFCDGLDCWGNAYYSRTNPTLKLPLCTDLHTPWRLALTRDRYLTIAPNVTIYSPFVFTDPDVDVPYHIDSIKVSGQSGPGGYVYDYPLPITDLILRNNTIQQTVFQTTDIYDENIASPQLKVTLDYLKDESSLSLFPSNYECNIPY